VFTCMMLFEPELIPGLVTHDELVGPAEEAELIAHIATLDLTPFRFQGFSAKRLTTSFGKAYDFETGRLTHLAGDAHAAHELSRTTYRFR
jgi:hypothetical protein